MNMAEGRWRPTCWIPQGAGSWCAPSATGLLSAFGHNPTIAIRKFTGEAWFRPQAPEQSSLRLED